MPILRMSLPMAMEQLLDACCTTDPKRSMGLGADNMTLIVVVFHGSIRVSCGGIRCRDQDTDPFPKVVLKIQKSLKTDGAGSPAQGGCERFQGHFHQFGWVNQPWT